MNTSQHEINTNSKKPRLLEIDKSIFQTHFPQKPFKIKHDLSNHPLFSIERLLELSKTLPESCVEYNEGNIPANMGYKVSPRTELSVEETIRHIREAHSWMVLKYVEQDAEYGELLNQCLDQVMEWSESIVLGMFAREGFIFLSSPNSMTPFHVDPEHNFLLQIQGQKTVNLFDSTDRVVISEADIERGLFGKNRNLNYAEEHQARGELYKLLPGEGLHFPVAAPHWVKNGSDVSISFSITFRSRYSERDSIIRSVNAALRKRGREPKPIGISPLSDTFKYMSYRIKGKFQNIFSRTSK
jgi:hypothetical protein